MIVGSGNHYGIHLRRAKKICENAPSANHRWRLQGAVCHPARSKT
jgi:hypothetical protein